MMLLSGASQLLKAQASADRVEIACAFSSTSDFVYSSNVIDRLLTDYLGVLRVSGSTLEKHSSGSWIISADVFYPQGWGSVVIVLEQDGQRLYITNNSCAHECIPQALNPCVYKSEVEEIEPCLSVRCACVGEGESTFKITLGETRGLQRAALTMRTISPLCK